MEETKKNEPRHPGDAMAVISESITRFLRDPGAFMIETTTEDGFVNAFRGLQQKFPGQQLTVIPWRHQFNYREALGDEILVPTSFLVIGNAQQVATEPKKQESEKPTPEKVLSEVAKYFDVFTEDIACSAPAKRGQTSEARKVAGYILKKYLNLTYKQIARILKKKVTSYIASSTRLVELAILKQATVKNKKTFMAVNSILEKLGLTKTPTVQNLDNCLHESSNENETNL